MTQHCTITGTMLVPVHYIICTLKIVCFPEITVFVVVKINSFQCQCQCQCHCSIVQLKYILIVSLTRCHLHDAFYIVILKFTCCLILHFVLIIYSLSLSISLVTVVTWHTTGVFALVLSLMPYNRTWDSTVNDSN